MPQQLANALRHVLRLLDVKRLDVHHSRAQLPVYAELAPQPALRHFAVGELEHELVGAAVEKLRQHPGIAALAAWTTPQVAETDVQRELGIHALDAGVVQLHPVSHRAGYDCERWLVDLDEVGAELHQPAQLPVDDAGELLRQLQPVAVALPGPQVDGKRERPGAGNLHG